MRYQHFLAQIRETVLEICPKFLQIHGNTFCSKIKSQRGLVLFRATKGIVFAPTCLQAETSKQFGVAVHITLTLWIVKYYWLTQTWKLSRCLCMDRPS